MARNTYDYQINEESVCRPIARFKTKPRIDLEVEIYIMDSSNWPLDVKNILLVELYDSLCSWALHSSKNRQSSVEIVRNKEYGVFGTFCKSIV